MELLGLLVGFTSSKVADTTFSGSRGCIVCVSSRYELCIACQHWSIQWLEVDICFPLLDRERNSAASRRFTLATSTLDSPFPAFS